MTVIAIDRQKELQIFIDSYFNATKYIIEPMIGDAGGRVYYRLSTDSKSFIIMDCPPEYARLQTFVQISEFLQKINLSAPQIFHQAFDKGFLILEDFGNISLKQYISTNKKTSYETYCLIIDLLVYLQDQENFLTLPRINNQILSNEVQLFIDWYIPYSYNRKLDTQESDTFINIWHDILSQQAPMPQVMVLRDYHLENIMHLNERQSLQKLGLLDFQDAIYGSPVYDLVSILEDARFDVDRTEALKLIDYFSQKSNFSRESVLLNYHILGAQRNLRILGIFARKLLKDKDGRYTHYIPRVLKYLSYDLSHPTLSTLNKWFNNLK